MTNTNIILAITATTTALIAGLLYAYSCSVNMGLGKLPDAQYVAAMQSINKAIQNPAFFVSFMGTLILLPLSTYLHYDQPLSIRFWLLLTATAVYAFGVFGVTAFGNVPLNDVLDGFNLQTATSEAIAKQRSQFESAWNVLHTVRTIASIVALVLVIVTCLNRADIASKN